MSYALTTKSRIKDRLQITSTSFDTLFDNLILAVTERIEKMCNRRFMVSTWTNELYDGSDPYGTSRQALVLRNAPVWNITSIAFRSGLNSNPTWESQTVDEYDADMEAGILYFDTLPTGRRNVRVTYTAGYSGYSIGVTTIWTFNVIPTGVVDGVNTVFTLSTTASQVVVYADGMRIMPSNYTFTPGGNTVTFLNGMQPYSAVSIDYLASSGVSLSDPALPMDLVEVCEEAVTRIFKRRDSEGRRSEGFGESQVTWHEEWFSKDNLTTIKNYRRSSFL